MAKAKTPKQIAAKIKTLKGQISRLEQQEKRARVPKKKSPAKKKTTAKRKAPAKRKSSSKKRTTQKKKR